MRFKDRQISLVPFPEVNRPDYTVWLDADNSGKSDDLIVRSGEKRFWLVLDESGEWKFKAQLPLGTKQMFLGVGDFDDDGKPDIAFQGGIKDIDILGRNLFVLWGDGKPKTDLVKDKGLVTVQLVDLDNDRRTEILGLKREGSFTRLVVWRYDLNRKQMILSASPPFLGVGIESFTGYNLTAVFDSFLVFDLDGDGLKEIIACASVRKLSNIVHF